MRFAIHQHRWRLAWTLIFAGTSLCQSAPDQLQSLFREGAEQMHVGNASAAEAAFRKATEMDPSFAPAHLDLGLAELRQGKLPEAITHFSKVIQLRPSDPEAHFNLGFAYLNNHQPADAAGQFSEELGLAPNFTWFLSDNLRLRAQYTHTTALDTMRPEEKISLQATFSLGNLKQLD